MTTKNQRLLILLVMLGMLLMVLATRGKSATIPESLAVKAIMGEASGEGYKGMLAVACAIRNRGTLQGVYGVKAKHIYKEPKWVWVNAQKAWRESVKKDIVGKASFWENTRAFGHPYWEKDMVITIEIGNHRFMKPKGKV